MTKQTETIQRVALAKLSRAQENVRSNSKELGDIPALALSIVTVGDLIEPLKAYADGDGFKVWDGGRRLAALEHIAKDKALKMPPALAAGVPLIVTSKDRAALLSRATFVREALDPAEEFVNYKTLLDAGLQPTEIAAACAVATPRVRQLLRLCGVAPAILDEFKAHKLALDVVEAFSISADHARQVAVWEAVKGKKAIDAWDVKQALQKGAIGANERIALFVGRDAYEAAGGTFLQDLFTGRDDEAWADRALAVKLFDAKLKAAVDKVAAEGWAWVKTVDHNDYTYERGMQQLPKPPGGKWAKDVMAGAGAFIKMKYNGDLDVQRGWTTLAKANKAAGAPAPAKKPAQAEPALYGFSHGGHKVLTQAATKATCVGLLRKPAAAYDGVLTHLAYLTFGEGYSTHGVSRLAPAQRWGNPPTVHVEGEDEFEKAREAWSKRLRPLAKDRVTFCDYIGALPAKDKAALLAICFGLSLDGHEEKIDAHNSDRWAHLGWLANQAGVEPSKAWTPGVEFLKAASRDALLAAVKEFGGAEGMQNAKKGELVAYVAAQAKAKGWTPKLLATFADVKPAKPQKPATAPPPATGNGDDLELTPALRRLAGGAEKTPATTDA